jgi:hypothetical protein
MTKDKLVLGLMDNFIFSFGKSDMILICLFRQWPCIRHLVKKLIKHIVLIKKKGVRHISNLATHSPWQLIGPTFMVGV